MSAKVFSIFADERNDHSKMVKQLLSDEVPPIAKSKPHRPVSANPIAGAAKPHALKHKNKASNNTSARDELNKISREDLILELQELKKKHRSLEEVHNHIKAENQRLESDAAKQQRRIDQLLNLSDGAKNIGISSEMRRDIEKSILVRQLKNQINNLRNDFADKESELESLKRSIKSTHVAELTFERDEYFLEVQRLKAALIESKEELHRERQRREWNTRVAGDASEDLRREVARLSSGYQSMLANISSSRATSASGQRPSTTNGTTRATALGAMISGGEYTPAPGAAAATAVVRPASAAATSSAHAHSHSAHHSPAKEGSKRPLSATSKNTPLSAYYQADHIPNASDPHAPHHQSMPASVDPLDNFGLPGHSSLALKPSTGAVQEIQALLQEATQFSGGGSGRGGGGESVGGYSVGDRVQGQFNGGASWYNGEIRSYNSFDGTYAVQYDDGDFEPDVPLARLRAVARGAGAAGVFDANEQVVPRPMPALVPTLAAAPASHPALMGGMYGGGGFASSSPAPKPKPALPLSAAPYKVGDKVEALYYKGTTWYGGKIHAVHPAPTPGDGDFVFDIAYDDGDRELKVPISNIRAKASPAGAASANAAPPPTATGTGKDAPKAAAPLSSSTSPRNNNDSSNKAVATPASPTPAQAPGPTAAAKFKMGDKVEGFYGGGPNWYSGKIGKVNAGASPTYTIDYDDGDREVNVAESLVRPVNAAAPSPRAASSSFHGATAAAAAAAVEVTAKPAAANPYKQGDRVQGYYEDLAAWFDGTVVVARADGTCHVGYDDGDVETHKPINKLRPLESAPKSASPPKAAAPVPVPVPAVVREPSPVESLFKVNDRVEGKYGNGDDWYPAVVTAVTNPGLAALYSLEYDDGDKEDLVDDTCIRLMALPARTEEASATAAAVPFEPVVRVTPTAAAAPAAARKQSIVSTNLDSFLNDLSDDDEDSAAGAGGLDSGRGVMLRPQQLEGGGGGAVLDAAERSKAGTDDGYEEDFDA